MSEEGYRSPLTPGGLIGCAATLPVLFLVLLLFEDAMHSVMPWWHWPIFAVGLIAVPAAVIAAVKWVVDRLIARRD